MVTYILDQLFIDYFELKQYILEQYCKVNQ